MTSGRRLSSRTWIPRRWTPGNVGVRIWGVKPADPKVVAHIAGLLGAPAPA